MNSFHDKTVIVTGGANGIGKEIVNQFAYNGANVIIGDIDDEKGKCLQNQLLEQGKNALYVHCDVTSEEDVKLLIRRTMDTYGSVNILINNAGISKFTPLFELSLDEWDYVLNTNLRSVFLCSREAAKVMGEGSSIINISSTRAFMSEENTEAYSASKGGIVSITHALARTLSTKGIVVNCISPGWIETSNYENLQESDHLQHLSNRVGKPEDVARCCLFLSQKENNFITGENITIDGGMTKKMVYED